MAYPTPHGRIRFASYGVASLFVSTARDNDGGQMWIIHEERLVDDSRRLDLRIAHVELPDGVQFEQYVLRMPSAAIAVPVDESGEHVLMIWRRRFVVDRWSWELPGGYVDPGEDPAICAAREVEEETGWRPRSVRALGSFQPLSGTAENILFVAEGCEPTGKSPDINEVARVAWIPLDSVVARIAKGEIIGAAAQIGLLHLLSHRPLPGGRL